MASSTAEALRAEVLTLLLACLMSVATAFEPSDMWTVCLSYGSVPPPWSCVLGLLFFTRWMPLLSTLSMAPWQLWAQMAASASGTRMPAPSWRPQNSWISQSQPAASTTMEISAPTPPVMTGQRCDRFSDVLCYQFYFKFQASALVAAVMIFCWTNSHCGCSLGKVLLLSRM